MKVGFFHQGDQPEYLEMARRALASVRSVMPGVEVHHLTDEHTPAIEGVDSTRVFYGEMPMAVRRMLHHSACAGEWLFIDTDIRLVKDVRAVFEQPFDVALTDRAGTITHEGTFATAMPYNIGVTFSRSQAFWCQVANHLQQLPAKQQQWMGDQMVVNAMVKAGGMGFDIKILPGSVYNYPPKSDKDAPEEAAILHYKGIRKKYMLEMA